MNVSKLSNQNADCLLCEKDKVSKCNYKFYCKLCDYSYCFDHSPVYEDIACCEKGHNLEIKILATARLLCCGCNKQVSKETLACTVHNCKHSNYCYECIPIKKRCLAEKLYLD